LAVIDVNLNEFKKDKKGVDVDLTDILNQVSPSNSSLLNDKIESPIRSKNDEASLGLMAGAIGTEIAISEAGRFAGAAAAGPLGFVIGGLTSGAYGSLVAQRMIDPDNISYGRVLADAFINLIPGSKAAKGTQAVADAVARQGAVGAGIAAGGETIQTAYDEKRLPTIDELTDAGMTGAALGTGLGLTGVMFNRAYSKIAGLPERDVTKLIEENDPDVKGLYNNLSEATKKNRTEFQQDLDNKLLDISEQFSDASVRTKIIQDEVAGGQYTSEKGILKVKGNDEADYYLNKRLATAKIDAQTKKIETEDALSVKFLAEQSIHTKRTPQELSESINDYLHAKHALSYNKNLGLDGAAGKTKDGLTMTNAQAKAIIDKFEKANLHNDLKFSIDLLKNQSKRILDIAVDGGLISTKQANDWRKVYPDYVPMYRILDETNVQKYFNPRFGGLSSGEVKSTGFLKEKGDVDLEVSSIRQNVYDSLTDVIRRAETNKANLAFKRLLDQNRDVADQIVAVNKGTKDPYFKADNLADDIKKDDTAFSIFENGEQFIVKFKDAKLAKAFKGTPKKEMNSVVESIFNLSSNINRWFGQAYTKLNPDFIIPNLFRDRTESAVNNMRKLGGKGARTLDPVRTAQDWNIVRKKLFGGKADNADEQRIFDEYDEFVKEGGSTGGLAATTIKEADKEIANLSKRLDSPVRRTADSFSKFMDKVNGIFEDSTRFGTYRLAIEAGLSPKRAALAARDSSFDPLLGGTDVGTLRALYLFANPALQGMKQFTRSMYNSPKVRYGVLSGLFATTYLLDNWNSLQDPEWEEKLRTTSGSNWLKNKNLVIVTGKEEDGSLDYVTIPIGYPLIPFKYMADVAQKMSFLPSYGQGITASAEEIANEARSELVDAYNPIGASLWPTPLRSVIEVMQNKDGLGRTIRPEWLEAKNMSAVEKVYPWTMQTQGGELAFALAETLEGMGWETSPENIIHYAKTVTGGPGATLSKLINIASKVKNGKEIDKREIPIVRRFFGDSYQEAFELRGGPATKIEEFDFEDETLKARDSRIASQIYSEYKDNPERRGDILTEALADGRINTSIAKKLIRKEKESRLGITSADRRAKQLSLPKRVEYLISEMEKMDIPTLQNYIIEQKKKGIITKDVIKLLKQDKNFQNIRLGRPVE
jgi:hypothetical protein